jgi:hypothetical protein
LPFDPADFAIEPGRKSRQLTPRDIHNYLDLFSSRQLLYLHHAIQLLPQFEEKIRLNLGLLVSTSLEFNAMLCGYKGKNKRRAGAIRHTFSHHAYSFPYTALENNPVYPRQASGTLQKLFQARIRNGRLWAQKPRERVVGSEKLKVKSEKGFVAIVGETDGGMEVGSVREMMPGRDPAFLLLQGSSTQLDLPDGSVDFIVTDPPYFDSVQYSDLAAFFRVWLEQLLPEAATWRYDTQESAVDPHQLDSESRYTELMSGIFAECRRVLKAEKRPFHLHLPPLESQRVGGADRGAAPGRFCPGEPLRGPFGESHFGTHHRHEGAAARCDSGVCPGGERGRGVATAVPDQPERQRAILLRLWHLVGLDAAAGFGGNGRVGPVAGNAGRCLISVDNPVPPSIFSGYP